MIHLRTIFIQVESLESCESLDSSENNIFFKGESLDSSEKTIFIQGESRKPLFGFKFNIIKESNVIQVRQYTT